MKKFLALLVAVAQLMAVSPFVLAEDSTQTGDNVTGSEDIVATEAPTVTDAPEVTEAPAENKTVVSYSSDAMYMADGITAYPLSTNLPATEYNKYGITVKTADGEGGIWGVQRLSSINYAGVEGLRFGTRSPKTSTTGTIVDWDFTKDTVNNPEAMTGDGYIYESEFMIQLKDSGVYASLNLMGKDEEGNSVKMGEIRFVPDKAAVNGSKNSAKAYVVNQVGVAQGEKVTIKATSDKSFDWCGELLFVRVKLDMLNNTVSAWLVPRKDEAGTYEQVEPTEANLLVENAPMQNTAVQFTGFNYVMTNYKYGNCVWIKNVSVAEYTPDFVEATPTPTPRPTEGHEEGVALKFAVLSDTQYGRASQKSGLTAYEYAGEKFKSAVNQVIEKAGGIEQLDALLIAGDITHNSTAAEYQAFVADLKEVIPQGSHTKVMFLRGNHDAKPNLENNFFTYLSEYDNTIASSNNVYDIYGYKFITVSQDTQRTNDEASSYDYIHSPQTVEWFSNAVDEASAEAAEENKPVFIGMHPAVKDTIYGSFPVTGYENGAESTSAYWGTTELYDSLKDHSNVITFSGHSHWDMANERSIHQKEFTSLNTGAVNNMEIEDCWDEAYQPKRFGSNENENSGYYIEVGTDNKVTVHRMDFYREREFKQPWVIDVNDKENWAYTDTRDQVAPYFTEDAEVTVSAVTETGCRVDFTQAKDDETDVGHYDVEIVDTATNETVKKYTVSSYYWQGDQAPAVNYWNVSDLENATEYKAVITAYDSFYTASSNKIESEPFTTKEREVKPQAITKVSFNKDGITDTSEYARFYNMQPVAYGETEVTYNDALNMYEASFAREADENTSSNFFKVMFDNGRKELMQGDDGYTIEVMFSPSVLNPANNIIGMAQSSGFDIETTDDGTLEAYVRHNGAWVKDPYPGSSLKTETDKYYHLTLTYDGSYVKVYNNGELLSTNAATGDIEFYSESDPNYGMVIGGDYNPTKDENGAFIAQTAAQNAFSGKIVFTNIYDGAFNAKEVKSLYNKYSARANLTKIDELNNLLSSGEISSGLLEEGWTLMADVETTDSDIESYIAKVNSGKAVNYSINASEMAIDYGAGFTNANYGITANTAAIWSVVRNNLVDNCYTDALRFSTRGNIGNKHLGRFDFAKDTVNNPDAVSFEGGKYVYETEFSVIYKDSGVFDMSLLGRDATGAEKKIATLRTVKSSGDYKYTGESYFLDTAGNKIGSSVKYQLATDDAKYAATVLALRVELDLENGIYSAYLVPRKSRSGAYTGAVYSSKTKIVDAQPIRNDVKTLDATSIDITNSKVTNIYWINNIEITGVNGKKLTYVNSSLSADTITTDGAVSATVENKTESALEMSIYSAQYAEDGSLIGILKTDKTVDAGKTETFGATVTLLDTAKTVKILLWDSLLKPYEAETITR